MEIDLLQYAARDGILSFPDSFIRGLYLQMVKDKTHKTVFFDGCVQDEHQFLQMMKFGHNSLFVVKVDDHISGIVWLNNFEARFAWFHFCFFSNVWGEDTTKIGKYCVLELLHMENGDGYLFDMLCGLVPESNAKAINWCHKMNFEILGRLPCSVFNAELQKSGTGVIFYVERGKYHG